MTREMLFSVGMGLTLLMGGCPNVTPPADDPAVTVIIAASATNGPAPLTVSLSGTNSTSVNGGDLSYSWNLGDGTSSDRAILTHAYANPGRYEVTLKVTDSASESNTAIETIQVQGQTPTAAIAASKTSGPAPLTVNFDGSGSSAPDDTIYDYFWEFGDLSSGSRESDPRHVFNAAGVYTVTLRVVTAGGVEASTTATINVTVGVASLQFDGGQFATLPLATSQGLADCTLEAWVKPDAQGGTVAALGNGALTLAVLPSQNLIRLQVNGTTTDVPATAMQGVWRQVAVSYSAASGASIYLDGAPLGSAAASGGVTIDRVTLGNGYRGKIAEVRLWSIARSSGDIAADSGKRASGLSGGLLGAWGLSEGSGQALQNRTGGPAGALGLTSAAEASDPAWSTDGPSLD